MTYQEIKDRLSKCEVTLEKLKNSSSNSTHVRLKTEKLEILRESYVKLLKEAEKTAFINGNPVEYEKEDELKKYKDNSDVKSIKTAQGKDIKEQDGAKFSIEETKSIAKSVGKAVAMSLKTLGDEVATMKARNIEENSFEIYVQYKNDADDEFSFYVVDDTLHLTDFSFDKELTDVGVKPSGEAVVNVDVLANELVKHFKSMNEKVDEKDKPELKKLSKALSNSVKAHQDQKKALDKAINTEGEVSEAPEGMYYIKISKDAASQNKAQVIFNDLYDVKYELNDDPDGVIMYFKKEDFDAGIMDDLEGDGVQILDTNIPDVNEDAEEDAKNDADYAQGWHDDPRQDEDTDVGHQDDEPSMLGASAMETAEYAAKLVKKLQRYDQHDGEVDFPNWWQKKLILARDYISAAYHYLDSEEKQPAIDQLALESKVNEGRGDLQTIVGIIEDRAAESGFSVEDEAEEVIEAIQDHYKLNDVEENVDKVAGGIPYRQHGNKVIISEPLDDATKERLIGKAKEHGYFAQPNMAGGITITLKKGMYEELDEMVDPSYADMLAQFIILMGSGYGALQAVKKLGDETGDISLDSVKKAIQKHKGQKNEEVGGQSISDLKPGDKFEYNGKSFTLVKHKEGNIATVILPNGDTSTVSFGGKINTGKKAGIGPDAFGQGKGHHIDEASLAKIQKAHSLVVAKMKELVQHYKTGDTSVVPQLKDLTAKKKELERQLDDKVAGTGRDQELSIQEAESTCCGKCGRKHVKGTKCKTPYLKGKDHCRTR